MADRKYFENESLDPVDEILRRNAVLERRVQDLERFMRNQNAPAPLSRIDPTTFPDPYEGQRAIDETDEQHTWYSDGAWRKAAAGGVAIYEIKVFEDENVVVVTNGKFDWPIPEELDGAVLVAVEAGVSTVSSSGSIQIQLRKFEIGSGDMLTTKLTIDVGERNSMTSATQPVIDTTNDDVARGGWIAIDVDAAGVDAKGLTLKAAFATTALASITLTGAKGDPGGVINWTGDWNSGTTYAADDAVNNGGTSYVATAPSTNVEPGVTSGWQSYWMVLAGGQQISEILMLIDGGSFVIGTGIKGWLPVNFDCTIVEATLLADIAGSMVIDIWKDTYANYPPTVADTITASAKPTLSSAIKTTDTALTGWTTAITAGDILLFNVDSCSLIKRAVLSLKVLRS